MSPPYHPISRTSYHFDKMQNLYSEVNRLATTPEMGTMPRVQEIILESTRAVEHSISPNEMMLDARILQTGTSAISSTVVGLNTSLITFSETNYARGILSYIENTDQVVMVDKEWSCLAPITYKMFKKASNVPFMIGSVKLDAEPPKRKVRAERLKKTPEPVKTCLTSVTETPRPPEETNDIYEHILKWLVRHYKKNDKKPLSYFHFVINPFDYWKTIENIFYFAFLVRDGSVKMKIIDGLPFIEPVLRIPGEIYEKPKTNFQFCFSLSMTDWTKCVQTFGISNPGIPVFSSET